MSCDYDIVLVMDQPDMTGSHSPLEKREIGMTVESNTVNEIRTKKTERVTIMNIDPRKAKRDQLQLAVEHEQQRRQGMKGWTVHDHCMIWGALGLAGCLLAVSIHHLAAGLNERTNIAMWEAWCLAIFFDMACVLSKLYLADTIRRLKDQWFIALTATGMITTVFGFSVYLNRIAFGDTELGITLGWTVPAMVISLSVLGFWKLGTKLGNE